MQQLTSNVFISNDLSICNLGLITTKDGLVIIDTPNNPLNAVKWREEVKSKGDVRYLINTEEHGDHCTGTWFFPGILISSQFTRDKISKMSSKDIREAAIKRNPAVTSLMQSYEMRLADISFNGTMDLHLGDHLFQLFPVPGHTLGGIGVFIPRERVVFTCDAIFHKCKTWLHDADPDLWLKTLDTIGKLEVDYIVPGHGDVCKKDYLPEQAAIVKAWVSAVKKAIAQGWSVDEAVARIVPPDPYPKQASAFIPEEEINKRTITHLYELYSKKN